MRRWIFWLVLALVLCVVNGLIAQKEHLRGSGQRMLLRLAPVDPRSIMQGDYMVLRYEISRKVPVQFGEPAAGHLVVSLDSDDVATFVRLHAGGPLAAGERLLRYRTRGQVRLGAESFFFQEGHEKYYRNAKYGELRVAPSGNSVLVGLCDAKLRRMGPATESEPPPGSRPVGSGE